VDVDADDNGAQGATIDDQGDGFVLGGSAVPGARVGGLRLGEGGREDQEQGEKQEEQSIERASMCHSILL
jgi:hypothetical protein